MSVKISELKIENKSDWDSYVKSHPMGNVYQLSGWKTLIENTYGHKSYYLMATHEKKVGMPTSTQFFKNEPSNIVNHGARESLKNPSDLSDFSRKCLDNNSVRIVGVLPLVHLKNILFGNSLVSIPFFDMGGVLADNNEIETALVFKAIKLGKQLCTSNVEFRSPKNLEGIIFEAKQKIVLKDDLLLEKGDFSNKTHKVRMIIELPESSDALFESFKSKLRSQIRRPQKEGLFSKVGGLELLEDFYTVFAENMRDLGSPVHSKLFIENTLKILPEYARLVVVYKGKRPLACSLIAGFKNTLENPWASSLRQFARSSPNMLLYWKMLEYACDHGYREFNFGRSAPGGGTYKFKRQWGAKPVPLYWQYILLNGKATGNSLSGDTMFQLASEIWKRLPITLTRVIGPSIRKHIGL